MTYFLPLSATINSYTDILRRMEYFHILLGFSSNPANLKLPWNVFEPRAIDIIFKFLNEQMYFIGFILLYWIIIKNGRRNNISYFSRFHLMHAMLLLIGLMPFSYLLNFSLNSQIGGKFLLIFWEQLSYTLTIGNFSVILYCMFSAANNNYFKIPIITEGSKLHIGLDR